ncbi:hypothetical protein [Streptomyces atratus]|uniref:hypothetical protein n=1 Tax=Streptomyces atratus TaxID=1893 RepID=UPI002250F0C7|nr:hypothetical protein [Streptomyces atratus]MCX5345901.1 hypothetical protein [Streptomyces atratus]
MAIMATRPHAGLIDDMTEDDNNRGPEPDETELHQVVRHLVVDGDYRAWKAVRRARRTFADMVPGAYDRQPVLHMTTADIVFKASEQARRYAA